MNGYEHCLNLLHTHETSLGIESAENCSTTGDLVCDTPADPNLGINNVNEQCEYTKEDGFKPLTNNIMSYSKDHCRVEFTDEQGYRMRSAIANDPILLSNNISNHCVRISQVDDLCASQSTTVSLIDLSGAIRTRSTIWTASSNIEIISSNNSCATLRLRKSLILEKYWIKATLNNGIEITKAPRLGYVPSTNHLTFSSPSIRSGKWTLLKIFHNQESDMTTNVTKWEWLIPSSMVRQTSPTNPHIVFKPLTEATSMSICVRACNSCGCSNNWICKWFDVLRGSPNPCNDMYPRDVNLLPCLDNPESYEP